MPNKKVKSVADLLKHLKTDIDNEAGPVWYRGHSDQTWKLLPAYDRLAAPPPEYVLLNRFRQNANLLLSSRQVPKTDFDWMFIMQHYGVPTRLLDWTESPLIGLYFALELGNPETLNHDGALWVLYPHHLNHMTNSESYIPAFEEELYLGSYSVENYAKGKDKGILPVAAMATRNNPRIQAQLGVFTISHLEKRPLERVGKGHIRKYVVPSASKRLISEELSLLGVSKFQVFPELAVIGEMIKEQLS